MPVGMTIEFVGLVAYHHTSVLHVMTSPITSFVLAGLSVTQLIFMAETGILIYCSSIPLPIRHLAAVFVIRTIIALPILVAIAHWRAGG